MICKLRQESPGGKLVSIEDWIETLRSEELSHLRSRIFLLLSCSNGGNLVKLRAYIEKQILGSKESKKRR